MNVLQKIFFEPFEKFLDTLLIFMPNLLTSIFLFVAGIALAVLVKIALAKVFKVLGIDRFSSHFGFPDLLKKGGISESLSELLAKFTGGMVLLIFILLSMRALEVQIVEKLLEKLLFYLPNIVVAFLILVGGYLLGNFFGRAALIAAVNAGMRLSRLVGAFVRYTIIIVSATMAMEHAGIGKKTVEIAFAVVFGGVVLALALAFGLGGKEMAADYLAKKLKGEKDQDKDEIHHL
jgi:hypothetical protein